jgi:hypothetical protein
MRKITPFALALLASSAALADGPSFKMKEVPTQLSLTACRVDDWTGKRPLPEGVMPSRDWRDLEWRRGKDHALQCKHVIIELQDAVEMNYSSKEAAKLHPDWSEHGQCAARSMDLGPRWAAQNPGYWPLAIGCPKAMTKKIGGVDVIYDYAMPPCPSFEPGTEFPMKCEFSEGLI